MKIAIQGVKGSFHHQAAIELFGDTALELVECSDFKNVFESADTGQADYGLCAIENNLHGSINEVYRLLQHRSVWISRDLRMSIVQNLIAAAPIDLDTLQSMDDVKILSHPVALAQVDAWLSHNLPRAEREERDDTAASVKYVMDNASPHILAVGSVFAATSYGATVVASDIQDDAHNYTRFILFSRSKVASSQATHCSIILTTDHTPGSLLRCLQVFEKYACNLTKLDSHPIPGDSRHYAFYIDYELPEANAELIAQLEQTGSRVKVLGEYESSGTS